MKIAIMLILMLQGCGGAAGPEVVRPDVAVEDAGPEATATFPGLPLGAPCVIAQPGCATGLLCARIPAARPDAGIEYPWTIGGYCTMQGGTACAEAGGFSVSFDGCGNPLGTPGWCNYCVAADFMGQ